MQVFTQMLILLDVGFHVVKYLNKDHFVSCLSLMHPKKQGFLYISTIHPPNMQRYLRINPTISVVYSLIGKIHQSQESFV